MFTQEKMNEWIKRIADAESQDAAGVEKQCGKLLTAYMKIADGAAREQLLLLVELVSDHPHTLASCHPVFNTVRH